MYATVAALVDEGTCTEKDLEAVAKKLQIDRNKLDPANAGPAQVHAAKA